MLKVVNNSNCSRYEYGYYLDARPDGCNIKSTLTVDDFEKEYSLIKILNNQQRTTIISYEYFIYT